MDNWLILAYVWFGVLGICFIAFLISSIAVYKEQKNSLGRFALFAGILMIINYTMELINFIKLSVE